VQKALGYFYDHFASNFWPKEIRGINANQGKIITLFHEISSPYLYIFPLPKGIHNGALLSAQCLN